MRRADFVREFCQAVFNTPPEIVSVAVDDILRELALDLDFYEPNPEWRLEDSSYYGQGRLEEEIRSGLARLKAAGVDVRAEADLAL